MDLSSAEGLDLLIMLCETFDKLNIRLNEKGFNNLIQMMHEDWEPLHSLWYISKSRDLAKLCLKYALFGREEVELINSLLDKKDFYEIDIDGILEKWHANNFICKIPHYHKKRIFDLLNEFVDRNPMRLKQLFSLQSYSVFYSCLCISYNIDFPNYPECKSFKYQRSGWAKALCSCAPKEIWGDIYDLLYEGYYNKLMELMATVNVKYDKSMGEDERPVYWLEMEEHNEKPFYWEKQVMDFVSQNEDATSFFAKIDWESLGESSSALLYGEKEDEFKIHKVLSMMKNK